MSCQTKIECESIRAELAVSRERLGPAGYNIIKEVAILRSQLADRDSRIEKLREALGTARFGGPDSEMRKMINDHADIAIRALKADDAAQREKE